MRVYAIVIVLHTAMILLAASYIAMAISKHGSELALTWCVVALLDFPLSIPTCYWLNKIDYRSVPVPRPLVVIPAAALWMTGIVQWCAVVWAWKRVSRPPGPIGYCEDCGYDLRTSIKTGRCPECGERISDNNMRAL